MEDLDLEKMDNNGEKVYCVTGANGYIGSSLVKLLLQNGYTVHATVRNPEKWSKQLLSVWDIGGKKVKIFKADLEEEGSYDEAVKDCHGVFHVAASMQFSTIDNPNFEYVESNIIEPAIKGTLNLLKSCSKYKVKRVVFTSSISTLTAKDSTGNWRQVVDETCQTPIHHVFNAKAPGWVYVVSKLMTEQSAFNYAKQNDIDLVSVITTTVGGPFLTSTVPASIQVILSPITGDSKYLSILLAVHRRMGSIALVHIEDICNAHLFLMNHKEAKGRFICSSGSCLITHLVNHLKQHYPNNPMIHRCSIQGELDQNWDSIPCEISSKRLTELGFKYKHDINHIINQTIASCVDFGFLSPLNHINSNK